MNPGITNADDPIQVSGSDLRLIRHRNGGWALPGGGFTFDPYEAARILRSLEELKGDGPDLDYTKPPSS